MERTQERGRRVRTAGRWPWRSASAKKCVTTYLPNTRALKMDGAESGAKAGLSSRRGEGRGARCSRRRAREAGRGGSSGADLGGSNETCRRAEEEKGFTGRAVRKTDLRGGAGLYSKG